MSDVRKILQLTKGKSWFKIGKWKEPGFLQDIIVQAELEDQTNIILPHHPTVYLIAGFNQFILASEYQMLCKKFKQDLVVDPKKILFRIRREVRSAITATDRFNPTNLSKSNLRRYIELIKILGRQSLRFILLGYALEDLYPQHLPKKFSIRGKNFTPQTLLAVVALPKKTAPMILEKIDLLEIAALIKNEKNVTAHIKKHAARFGWMNSICWWDEPFPPSYYRQAAAAAARGNPAAELRTIWSNREQQKRSAAAILRELKTKYPQAYFYIDMIREMADMREASWDAASRVGARVRPLFKKLAKKIALTYNQLMMCGTQEMLDLIAGNRNGDKKMLASRLRAFAVFRTTRHKHTLIFSGKTVQQFLRTIEGKALKTDVLKGLTIWPGIVRGRARVMRSKDEVATMHEGEILVCPMTDPDYMPAIYQAAALVTDQGGVLCHAAIIARELQKPCIVGTQTATRAIKSGDIVEVNATAGLVRKI